MICGQIMRVGPGHALVRLRLGIVGQIGSTALKEVPRDRILTIIAAPALDDVANIFEQGLKIGRQRIAGSMQVPNQLIQIISQADELSVNKPFHVAAIWPAIDDEFAALIEKNRTPEMNRPHTDRVCAPPDALQLAGREAQIELLRARFGFLWPAHGRLFLGRAHASWGLGPLTGPQREPFA